MMLKILQKRFLKEVILYFILTFTIFEVLFVMVNVFQLVKKGLDLVHALPIVPYILPASFPYTLPMSLMAAITLVVGRMIQDNEILIMKSSGMHIFSLSFPICIFGLFLSFSSYLFQAEFTPYCYEQMKVRIRNSLYAHFMTGKGQNRTFQVGSTKIYCDCYQEGQFQGLVIFARQKKNLVKVVARHGVAEIKGKDRRVMLTLFDVSIVELQSPLHSLKAKELSIFMDLHLGSWEREEFKSTRDLWKQASLYEKKLTNHSPQVAFKKKKYFQKEYLETLSAIYARYTMALACFSLTLIALAVSFSHSYSHRLLPLLMSLLGSGILFFAPFLTGRIFVKQHLMSPELGYLLSHLIAIPIGGYLFYRTFSK